MSITITNVSPLPGTNIALGAPLTLDVTWSPPESIQDVLIQLSFDGGQTWGVAWDGSGFVLPYVVGSQRVTISGGHRFTIRRSGRWPEAPMIDVRPLGAGGGGGITLSSAAALAVGTAAAGSALDASRSDHVHAHGNQLGGALHADATSGVAGFMSAAQYVALAYLLSSVGASTGYVAPSGGDDYAALQAAITAGVLRLQPFAQYYTSQRLIVPTDTNVRIEGNYATIEAHSTWNDSGVDPDNRLVSMLSARGATYGTINTTLAATAKRDTRVLNLTSQASIVTVGMWLRLEGPYASVAPTANDSYTGQSIEIVQAASIAAPNATLTSDLYQHHAVTAGLVKSVHPVVNLSISNLTLRPGPKTIPVGLECTNAVHCKVDGLTTSGFSRSGVDEHSCVDIRINNHVDTGGSNGCIRVTNSHACRGKNLRYTGEDGRQHALGITRHCIMVDAASTHFVFQDVYTRGRAGSFRSWHGLFWILDGFDFSDEDGTQIILRAPVAERVTGDPGAPLGISIDGGCGPLNDNTGFSWGGIICNGVMRQARQTATATMYHHMCVSVHDHYNVLVNNVQLINVGEVNTSTGGFELVDIGGSFNNIQIVGVGHSIKLRNTLADTHIDNVMIDGRAIGSPSNSPAQYALVFGTTAQTGKQGLLKIGSISISNFSAPYWTFTSDWTSYPNREFWHIDNLYLDQRKFVNVRPYKAAGAPEPGQIMKVVNSGGNELAVENTGPRADQLICCSYGSAGWSLYASDGGWALYSSTAPVVGDHLYAHSDGTMRVNNAADLFPGTKWRAINVGQVSGTLVEVQRVSNSESAITATGTITANGFVGVSITGASAGALAIVGNNIGMWDGADLIGTWSNSANYCTLNASLDGLNLTAARNVLSSSIYNLITHSASTGQSFIDSNDTQLRNWAANKTFIAAHDTKGICIGATTETGQNGAVRLAVVAVPNATPTAGLHLWTAGGQLRTWDVQNVKQELSCQDVSTSSPSGATSKIILERLARATSTSAAAVYVPILLDADLPDGTGMLRVECEWGCYDTTSGGTAGGFLSASIMCVAGVQTLKTTTFTNQRGGVPVDNDTSGGAGLDTSAGPTIVVNQPSSKAISVNFTPKGTNNLRYWVRARVTYVEH